MTKTSKSLCDLVCRNCNAISSMAIGGGQDYKRFPTGNRCPVRRWADAEPKTGGNLRFPAGWKMTKIAILGFGRMGQEITKKALESGIDVVAAIDRVGHPDMENDLGTACGLGVVGVRLAPTENLDYLLTEIKPDVAIDFSSPDACMANSKIVLKHGICMVIGTTGFTQMQMEDLKKRINKSGAGAVISPNMSVGVNVFWSLVRNAARSLKDYDIEITETHHTQKKDAPSGTALKAAEFIAQELGRNLDEVAVYGRCGAASRKKGEIGIHSIRLGSVVGDHTVYFGNENESIEITHRAQSRDAFADGAIKAAHFIKGKKGVYDMSDVLGLGR